MLFEEIAGEITRVLSLFGCFYLITAVLGLLHINDNGSLDLITMKKQGNEVSRWLYQRISSFDHFLVNYTIPVMVIMTAIFDTLPKAAWRFFRRLIPNDTIMLS